MLSNLTKYNSPEEFIYEMKNAAIMATCKLRKAKDAINKTIEAKQKVLKEKFDNDAFKLIEEVEELKTKISEDQNYLENSCVQEALRKWHLLKIDFGDKKVF